MELWQLRYNLILGPIKTPPFVSLKIGHNFLGLKTAILQGISTSSKKTDKKVLTAILQALPFPNIYCKYSGGNKDTEPIT